MLPFLVQWVNLVQFDYLFPQKPTIIHLSSPLFFQTNDSHVPESRELKWDYDGKLSVQENYEKLKYFFN